MTAVAATPNSVCDLFREQIADHEQLQYAYAKLQREHDAAGAAVFVREEHVQGDEELRERVAVRGRDGGTRDEVGGRMNVLDSVSSATCTL